MDHTLQCYCHASDDGNLRKRCLREGRCIFYKSGTHPKAQRSREIMVGALTDYFNGVSFKQIQYKWKVSNGYITNMLARAGVPGRVLNRTVKGPELVTRKLIPYAGKEKGQ